MAEAVAAAPAANAVAAPTTAQPAADTTVYAGKYQGVASLEKGVRELYKSQGLAELPDGSLVGDGKFFKTPQDMEAAYKKAESLVGRPKEQAPPKPDTAMFPKEPEPVTQITDEAVDTEKVLEKAGISKVELVQLHKANALTEHVLDKIRENHPEYSKLGRKAGNRAVLNDIRVEMGAVESQEKAAAEAVGGLEALNNLGKNWTEYVPPERQQSLADLMNNPKTYVEAALLLKQFHTAKYGTGTGPKPVTGGPPTAAGPEEMKKAREAAFTRITHGRGTADDFAMFGRKVKNG